jgi:hypothetical protein
MFDRIPQVITNCAWQGGLGALSLARVSAALGLKWYFLVRLRGRLAGFRLLYISK